MARFIIKMETEEKKKNKREKGKETELSPHAFRPEKPNTFFPTWPHLSSSFIQQPSNAF